MSETNATQKTPVLCFIWGCWAYFTTQALEKQWGDDWDDAPYEHNAGRPYTYEPHHAGLGLEPWEIVKVAWEGPFVTPDEGTSSNRFSVKMINAGQIAWLRTDEWVKTPVAIPAGTPLPDFIQRVQSVGGRVFMEVKEGESGQRGSLLSHPLTLEDVEAAVDDVRDEVATWYNGTCRCGAHDALDFVVERLRQQINGDTYQRKEG